MSISSAVGFCSMEELNICEKGIKKQQDAGLQFYKVAKKKHV